MSLLGKNLIYLQGSKKHLGDRGQVRVTNNLPYFGY